MSINKHAENYLAEIMTYWQSLVLKKQAISL